MSCKMVSEAVLRFREGEVFEGWIGANHSVERVNQTGQKLSSKH